MLLLLFSLVGICTAMTDHKKTGNETSSKRTTLVFQITTKPGMDCFYHDLIEASKLRVSFLSVNQQLQHLHMRISSPNEVFSEWFDGIDRVEYNGEVKESGVHELCVTAKIGYGSLKVLLEVFVYNPAAIERSFRNYIEKNNIEASIQKTVERVFEKVFSMFYSLRVNNFHVKRDMHLQEKNIRYIDGFSTVQTVIMISSALVQVYLIRKFFYFDPKRIRI